MVGLHEWCRHLAEGTANQKRRAWRFLIAEGGLWRGCQEAVHDPSSLDSLATSYCTLQRNWNRSPLIQAHWGDADAVESQVGAAGRLLAAAAVATMARHGHRDAASLARWALRSAVPTAPGSGTTCRSPDWPSPGPPWDTMGNRDPAEEAEARVRRCFGALAAAFPEELAGLAAAQDAALSLLRTGDWQPSRCRRVPVLLARGTQGFLAWLWLEQVEGGFGQFFPAPTVLLAPVQPPLRRALEEAWAYVTGAPRAEREERGKERGREGERERGSEETGPFTPSLPLSLSPSLPLSPSPSSAEDGVRWWLIDLPREVDGAPMPVTGASIQAAAAVGLTLLLEGRPYDPGCAISATVSVDGMLGAVEGINGEDAVKLCAARDLQSRDKPATVVVSPGNRLAETAAAEWEARGVRVVVAASVAEALPLAGGLLTHGPPPRQSPRQSETWPDGRPAAWERRSDLYERLLGEAVARWAERVVPSPDRDQRRAFRRFAADAAERLWGLDATRSRWTEAEAAQAVRAVASHGARVSGHESALTGLVTRDPCPVTGDGAAPGVSPRPLLDDLCAAGILVPAGPDTADTALRFPDHSFAAYLTAGALAHRIQDEASSSATRRRVWEYLDRQAWDPAWQEVFIFLAAQLAEPVPLLDLLIAPRAAPGGDDFFHHRLATAALCLPEIAPHLQAPLAEVIDAVTTRAFSLWWQRRHESAELAGLTRITRALPALGVLNAPLDGTPLQEWLCRRLRASHAGERQAAAEALVHAGSRVPAPSLLTCLGEMLGATDAATRQLALETVMGLGGRAAVPTLLARLADLLCDPASAPQAALAVRCLGSAAATPGFLERLTRLLDDADTAIRQAAARAVGGIGSPAATPRILERLEALLRAESPELRHASLEAVRCLGSAATTEPLVNGLLDCFSDTHESIRQGAVEALAQLNFAASRPALLTRLAALLSDPAAEVRETASRAARVLGLVSATPQALDRLTQQLGSGLAPSPPIDPDRLAESLTGTDEFAREEAARVAAGRGTAAATPAVLAGLLALLRSPETRTRQAAAEALGSLMEQGVRIFPDTERGWVAYTVAELTQKKMPARR